MRSNNKLRLSIGSACLFLALGGTGLAKPRPIVTAPVARAAMVADDPVQIGEPYKVGDKSYAPADSPGYDEVGYAGTYTIDGAIGTTANGERFIAEGVTGTHKTLPLPSYVEVTSLNSGKTILVRINDRGPPTNDRIMDLSPGAAEQLGMEGGAPTPVRVRRVNPPEQERAVLRAHGKAAERLETPSALLVVLRQRLNVGPVATVPLAAPRHDKPQGASFTPPPARPASGPLLKSSPAADAKRVAKKQDAPPKAAPLPGTAPGSPPIVRAAGSYVVQVAAFSSEARANAVARKIGATTTRNGTIWRVRLGPFATQDAAKQAVRGAAAKGLENARIMANDAP
ncbi:RlpA-like double-psi beta-barrel domain-containing protein [Sphingobium sp. AN558]|uniref:septal ring lytic transglycosylase RlpA family protein n=1 Tax=Sphingobium sp. AN558 TaxID=3133442 RepID=UPI0030C4E0B2